MDEDMSICESESEQDHSEPEEEVYISPYNLNERAKKLTAPGAPEMPCICDPDCLCVPLCATDPTQNCLCEENGLFARVTQGMNIDDLDVPDLVRWRRQSSELSDRNSSPPSLLDRTEPPELLETELKRESTLGGKPSNEDSHSVHLQYTDEAADSSFDSNGDSQATQHDGMMPTSQTYPLIDNTYLPSEMNEYRWTSNWYLFLLERAAETNLEKHTEPPKSNDGGLSLAKRFFRTATDRKSKASIKDLIQSDRSMPGTENSMKRGTKRSLVDVSLPSLKRTFRR